MDRAGGRDGGWLRTVVGSYARNWEDIGAELGSRRRLNGQALRHLYRESVAVVVHRISVPSTVYPNSPCSEQNAPGWTPWA